MKFKNNLKRFISMSRQNGGFTLVELIVVIAILAILAGVAIPVYSGYITKANEAADQQLLSAVNRAFTAACMEKNVDMSTLVVNNPLVDAGNGTYKVDASKLPQALQAGFSTYFAGNQDSAFKVYSTLYYSKLTRSFVTDPDVAGQLAINYGGTTLYVSPEYIAALQGSTYYDMGMEGLLTQLDQVTILAGGMAGSGPLQAVLTGEDFTNTALDIMNIDTTNLTTPEQKQAALDAECERIARENLKKQGITEPTAQQLADAKSKVSANAAVLYTAQQTAQMSKEEANQLLTSASVDSIKNGMLNNDTSGQGMAQAALVCGMYTAYVNSKTYGPGEEKPEVNAINVISALQNDPEFKNYMTTEQGQKDLDGYLASLNMVNSSTGDASATEQLLINGFADPNLIAAMNGVVNGN